MFWLILLLLLSQFALFYCAIFLLVRRGMNNLKDPDRKTRFIKISV